MKKRFLASAVVALIASLGLATFSTPSVGATTTPVSPVPASLTVGSRIDEVLSGLSSSIPTFGGLYRDSEGGLSVYLKDSRFQKVAESAIALALGADRIPASGITFRQAQFEYKQLQSWYDLVQQHFTGFAGVVMMDLDEMNNHLSLSVKNDQVKTQVQAILAALNIPSEAVSVEVVGGVTLSSTLGDYNRPLTGGLAIGKTATPSCSLGFNAVRGTVSGFVTASHCTSTPWGYDGGFFYQGGSSVGSEDIDPGTNVSPCPTGYKCRYTDTAFIKTYALSLLVQ